MAKKENKQAEKPRETTVEFLASLSAVLVTGLFIITFIVQAFERRIFLSLLRKQKQLIQPEMTSEFRRI